MVDAMPNTIEWWMHLEVCLALKKLEFAVTSTKANGRKGGGGGVYFPSTTAKTANIKNKTSCQPNQLVEGLRILKRACRGNTSCSSY